MSAVYCPKCGNEHQSVSKYCVYCGEDLEDLILQYKDKRLPVKLNNEKSKKLDEIAYRQEQVFTPEELDKRDRRRRTSNILYIISAVILLLGIIILLFIEFDIFNLNILKGTVYSLIIYGVLFGLAFSIFVASGIFRPRITGSPGWWCLGNCCCGTCEVCADSGLDSCDLDCCDCDCF